MVLLSFGQALYISLSILGGLIVLILLLFVFYRNVLRQKNLKNRVCRSLYKFSNLNDYLLLNNYKINIDDRHFGQIDHILITNKFIVIINDFPISGIITGDYLNEHLSVTDKSGTKLIVNPLNYNINLTKRIAIFNNLDNSFVKGIVVTNDDSVVDVKNLPEQFTIVSKKDLKKTINGFDKVEVKPFKEDTVVQFINYLNDQNERSKAK